MSGDDGGNDFSRKKWNKYLCDGVDKEPGEARQVPDPFPFAVLKQTENQLERLLWDELGLFLEDGLWRRMKGSPLRTHPTGRRRTG